VPAPHIVGAQCAQTKKDETTSCWTPTHSEAAFEYWIALMAPTGVNQSINQILKAPHEHKRSNIPAQPHGQQTPRREASQAWGAKSESRKR